MPRRCDSCRADGAKLRCHKCQGCWSCNKACAKKFWPTHKKFCTDDPVLQRHVPIELAIERALKKAVKTEPPENATCYICLETEGPCSTSGGKVTRGCACRGPSAGFAHLECLEAMASRTPWIALENDVKMNRWVYCGMCRTAYQDAVALELQRRWWRRCRDDDGDEDSRDARRRALLSLDSQVRFHGEVDAANALRDIVLRAMARDGRSHFQRDLLRAEHLMCVSERPDEALELLTRLRPPTEGSLAEGQRALCSFLTAGALYALDRYEEALPRAVDAVDRQTKWRGPESEAALLYTKFRARVLDKLDRNAEARDEVTRVLAIQTRKLGADHPDTLHTQEKLDALSSDS